MLITNLLLSITIASGPNNVQTNAAGEGWVDSISNSGVAAGANSSVNQYFMWNPTDGNVFIGGVSPGNGVGGSAGVSHDGGFISGSILNPKSGMYEAAVFDVANEMWTPLGGIGGSSGSEISSGWNISGDGTTVVGLAWENAGTAYATSWNMKGEATSLGSSVIGSSTRANGVNNDGSVVVGWQDTDVRRGAVWVNGTQELIYRPDGEPAFEASAVSSEGEWITGIGIGSFWENGTTYRYNSITNVCDVIPKLSSGAGLYMAGSGISSDGQTIVGGSWDFGLPATFGNAFIWREGIGTQSIESYFDEIGVTYPNGFHFAIARSLSSDGSWMAGWGYSGTVGNTVSWFVELPSDVTCYADINDSGAVDVSDLLAVIAQWGQLNSPADVNGDGEVNVTDLLQVISAWGPCE